MRVERLTEVETTDIQIGDRIHVDHYTATCQEITPKGALFLMDQYLDKPYAMNAKGTHRDGIPHGNVPQIGRGANSVVYSNSDTLKHTAGSNPAIPFAESAHSAGASSRW